MPDFDPCAREAPVCDKLRSKALLVYGRDTADAHRTSRSSSYHCSLTQFVTGPDGALCIPEECGPARACFVAR